MILLIKKITKLMGEIFCPANITITHTIFKKIYIFSNHISILYQVYKNLIKGSRRANIMLPKGTKFCIDNALFSSKSKRNLLSFKNIHYNDYHNETNNEGSSILRQWFRTRSSY